MHLLALVPHDLHGRHRIHPCPSEIRARGMPEIVQPQARNPSPATGRSKGRPSVLPRSSLIQEDSRSVQATLFPQFREGLIYIWCHRDHPGFTVLGLPKRELPPSHVHIRPF